jgi:DNA-binding transcriptional MocR family regulator
MTNWRPDPDRLRRPVFLSLANEIARAIEDGGLAPGERLPTHRALAYELGVSVQTVSRAYEEAARRGLTSGQTGRGTFVREDDAHPAPPFIVGSGQGELIDLSILKPVGSQLHARRMKQALARLQDDLPAPLLFSFRPAMALANYREIATDWLKRCGLKTGANNIHITNGATPGMTVALMSVAQAGSTIVTEGIGHHTLRPLADYLGLRLKGLAIDAEGIVPRSFEAACRSGNVTTLFVVPSAANPTVAMMNLKRREAIVAIARKHGVFIIENDAWGPLVENRPPPLAALAPERTFYVTSFTKCVMPGLRTGYLVVPDAFVPTVGNRHLVTNWIATPMIAEIASRWVSDGTAWELLEWQRNALEARQELAREFLGDLQVRQHRHSLHAWLPLPVPWREDQFVSHALLRGVAVAPGASFVTDPAVDCAAVRISVGSTSIDELRRGLEVVARLVSSVPEPALLAI